MAVHHMIGYTVWVGGDGHHGGVTLHAAGGANGVRMSECEVGSWGAGNGWWRIWLKNKAFYLLLYFEGQETTSLQNLWTKPQVFKVLSILAVLCGFKPTGLAHDTKGRQKNNQKAFYRRKKTS